MVVRVQELISNKPKLKIIFIALGSFFLFTLISLITIKTIDKKKSDVGLRDPKATIAPNTRTPTYTPPTGTPSRPKYSRLFIRDVTENYWNRSGLINSTIYDEPIIGIDAQNVGNEATVYLYEATKQDFFKFFTRDDENNQINPNPDLASMNLVTSFKVDLTEDENTTVDLPIEGEGIWFVKVETPVQSTYSFINRSKIGVVTHEENGKQVYWAQNLETKRTHSEGAISIYTLLNKPMEIKEFPLVGGIAETPLYPGADVGILEYGSSTVIIPINLDRVNYGYRYESFSADQGGEKFFTYTDRPLYMPGEKVFYKSIVRGDRDGIYTIPKGSYTVTASKGWGENLEEIYKQTKQVNSFGALSGEIELPDNLKTGNYRLRIESNTDENHYSQTSFDVEYFRKPEYFVEISEPSKTEYIQGDSISLDINGQYFSGQPLAGEDIQYSVYSSDFYDYSYYSYYLSQSDNLSKRYRYGYRAGKSIKEGKVTLDNAGNVALDVDTGLSVDKKSQIFMIEISYKDSTGNNVVDTVNVIVRPAEYNIYAKEYFPYSYLQGTNINLPIILVPNSDSPVANTDLDVTIQRRYWVDEESDEPVHRLTRKTEEIDNFRLKTDYNGETTISFTPEKTGSYEMIVKGKDSRGNEVEKSFTTWVYGEDRIIYHDAQRDDIVTIVPHKDTYSPNERAEFTLMSDVENIDYFVTLERGFVRDYKIINFQDEKVKDVSFGLDQSMVPNMYIGASTFNVDEFYKETLEFKLDKEAVTVFMDVETDKDTYAPGDNVDLTIQTKDSYGNPISADVSISAVDKAIYELETPDSRNILDVFWPTRYKTTSMAHSLENINYSSAEGGGCFLEGTLISTDTDPIKIEDVRVGQNVLTMNESTNNTELKEVLNIQEHVVGTLLLINNKIKVTPNHYLRVGSEWKTANSVDIGDVLHRSDGSKETIKSIELIRGSFKVYNLSVKDNHNYFAENVLVHNEKGGVGRDVFENTAYWNPSIVTNENGQARLSFTLPDNLTTWVISGIGHTTDTKVGAQTKEIVVSKDIIARPILPNILRVGEKVFISSIVQNFTDGVINLTSGFEFDRGEVRSQKEFADDFDPNATKQYFWEITPNKTDDNAEMTFYAARTDNTESGDRITTKIPIKRFGYNNKSSNFYYGDDVQQKIELSPTADLDESSISVNIAPTLIGSLPSSFNYLINYPYGCIEQTMSRLVPLIIIKDNPAAFSEIIENKDIDKMIQKGFDRLTSLQNSDGSWSWWGLGNSDYIITSYVVEYLLKIKGLGYEPPQNILDSAVSFLENNVPPSTDSHSVVYRMYVLELAKPELYNNPISNFDNMNSDTLALAAMYNILNGVSDNSKNGIDLLVSRAKKGTGGSYWDDFNDKDFMSKTESTTSLALRALLMAETDDSYYANEAIRYLTTSRRRSYWSNTFNTANVLRAISEYTKYEKENASSFDYEVYLDNSLVGEGSLDNENDNVTIAVSPSLLQEGGSNLRILKSGEGEMYTDIAVNEFETSTTANPHKNDNGIKITREYVNEKGSEYSIGLGDTVDIYLTIEGEDIRNSYIAVEDFLPAGLIPINERFDNQSKSFRNYWSTYNYEYKLDGVVIPLSVRNINKVKVSYKARAISKGEFYAPPAVAELMYIPENRAMSDIAFVKVEEQAQKVRDITSMLNKDGSVTRSKSLAQRPNRLLGTITILIVTCTAITAAVFIIKKLRNDAEEKDKDITPDTDTSNNNN